MFAFQLKEKIGGSSEELSSEASAKSRPFVGGVSNSELIQLLSGSTSDAPESPNASSSQNTSGIPDELKAKYEQRSGVSMDDVSVHYNSDKPVQYGALAYTQGNDVYLGPGQEKHLGHELGHVIQQKQGRVPITGSVGGAPLNDDPALEQEADSFLSSNSPVQHITAGYHPDSGAPIQRLRINLAGDTQNSNSPEVQYMALFPIATGGEKLDVPDDDPDKVKETVVACQRPLGINEDIVFEGHGYSSYHDGPVTSIQGFSPKELAEMAKAIPKPDDWKGRILLFGCRAGNIALQVAKEYYNLTKKSVTVVGPKEKITVVLNPLDPIHPLFGFCDSEKSAELNSASKFSFLKSISFGFSLLLPLFKNFFRLLTAPLLKPEQRAKEVLKFFKEQLIKPMFNLSTKIESASDDFYSRYPQLEKKFQNYLDLYKTFNIHYWEIRHTLSKIASSPESDDGTIVGRLEHLRDFTEYAIGLSKYMSNERFAERATTFKSGLDFDDTEMMISATYTAEDEWGERALGELMDWFGDNTKENPKEPSDTK